MRVWNPFRRRCCEVLVLAGHDHIGAEVSGVLRVGDSWVEYTGVVIDPEAESDPE